MTIREVTDLGQGVRYYDLQDARDLCRTLIKANEADHHPGPTGSGVVMADVKAVQEHIVTDKDLGDRVFREAMRPCWNDYREANPGLADIAWIRDTGYLVGKYEDGDGWYVWHNDSTPGMPSSDRVAAGIMYLNDVAVGGETEFVFGAQVRPRMGRVLLFPPYWTHRHRGKVPLSGDKYILTTFFVSVPDPSVPTDSPGALASLPGLPSEGTAETLAQIVPPS